MRSVSEACLTVYIQEIDFSQHSYSLEDQGNLKNTIVCDSNFFLLDSAPTPPRIPGSSLGAQPGKCNPATFESCIGNMLSSENY
jgi:hypothetical protein